MIKNSEQVTVNSKQVIQKKLKKAMEFYQELGFEYLPIKDSYKLQVKNYKLKEDETLYENSSDTCHSLPNKEAFLKALRVEIGDCQRCKLSAGRTNIVFGEGKADAKLMFIGEAPGKEEDRQAKPFVGDAGKMLTNLIKKMGLRREDVYIANIVKCRPPNNRDPEEDEITACRPFVEKQIEIINPTVIMALGRIAAHTLIGTKVPITKLRGNFYSYKGIPVMPTFHPAYLIRNPKDKWLTWEDAQKVLEKIGRRGA